MVTKNTTLKFFISGNLYSRFQKSRNLLKIIYRMRKNVQQKVAICAKKQGLEENAPHRINSKAA